MRRATDRDGVSLSPYVTAGHQLPSLAVTRRQRPSSDAARDGRTSSARINRLCGGAGTGRAAIPADEVTAAGTAAIGKNAARAVCSDRWMSSLEVHVLLTVIGATIGRLRSPLGLDSYAL